jgi:hypothetical protein
MKGYHSWNPMVTMELYPRFTDLGQSHNTFKSNKKTPISLALQCIYLSNAAASPPLYASIPVYKQRLAMQNVTHYLNLHNMILYHNHTARRLHPLKLSIIIVHPTTLDSGRYDNRLSWEIVFLLF